MKNCSLRIAAVCAALLWAASGTAGAADFLADRHVAREADKRIAKGADRRSAEAAACRQCHKEATPSQPVKSAQCVSCHGDNDAVAKLTAQVKPNPHYNHLGDVACTDCHRGHEASALMCNTCHKFELNTP